MDQFVFIENRITGEPRFYNDPIERIVAHSPDDVAACFRQIEERLADGLHLAGFASYELGYLFEPCLAPLMPRRRSTALLDFGVFPDFGNTDLAQSTSQAAHRLAGLRPAWSEVQYRSRFDKVKSYIRSGDVYQVNLTFPMTGEFSGEALSLYADLRTHQPVGYGGLLKLGGTTLVSLSPELFFEIRGRDIRVRPMKGTAPRGHTPEADRRIADRMKRDEKSRAENLMIVDLLRNDLGRISEIGTVAVTDLFAIETFPTLHQMTSEVRASVRSDVGITDLFRNLFPCGSITGAPKIRAMEIIRELESEPRGAYCGAIGYLEPGGNACFNVAIRTMNISGNQLTYNVGSGVVADSDSKAEYEECLLKAKVLTRNAVNSNSSKP